MSDSFNIQPYIDKAAELLATERVSKPTFDKLMQILSEIEVDAGYLEERRSNAEFHFSDALKVIKDLEGIIDGKYPLATQNTTGNPNRHTSIPKYITFPKIGIAPSSRGGRGVYALEPIAAHEVIEIVPIIVCDKLMIAQTTLRDYYFDVESKNSDKCAIALGWGSMYNHDDEPAAHWIVDAVGKEIAFIASRSIEAEEEITVDYGTSYWEGARRKGTKKKVRTL